MPESALPTEQILTLLADAPARLAALTAEVPAAHLQTPPRPEEWAAVDVLAHMRACADQWGGAIAAILAQNHPTLRAINPRTWIEQTDYPQQAFADSLAAFTRQRRALLALLEPLGPGEWARGATVTGAGKPLERTVQFYAGWLARHERPHVKQIARLVRTR
ncbi:MAG TPA: DinB family protein [Chloroflexia bacterium]|nr:DinB family protein [Chloroflexia bacterium]